jgi:hypothetical protein
MVFGVPNDPTKLENNELLSDDWFVEELGTVLPQKKKNRRNYFRRSKKISYRQYIRRTRMGAIKNRPGKILY